LLWHSDSSPCSWLRLRNRAKKAGAPAGQGRLEHVYFSCV
jgi:hypothetical protein